MFLKLLKNRGVICILFITGIFLLDPICANSYMGDSINNTPNMEEASEIIVEEVKRDIKKEKQDEFHLKLDKIKHIEDKMEWFLAYKNLTYEYMKWIELPETVYDKYSEDEIKLIWRVVETETYDQDFESKVNVANVIFNRLKSGEFGETITEIITTPKQFRYGRQKITDDTIYAVMYAYEMPDTTYGALYFHSNEKTDKFNGSPYIFTDKCGHHFY